jgi:hypothetical protein
MVDFDVNSRELLRFFDEKPSDSERHATALNAVFGEDLGAGLLCHYLAKVCAAPDGTNTHGRERLANNSMYFKRPTAG